MSNSLYKTTATAIGSRNGTVSLSDNPTTFKLEKPSNLGGKGADKGLNPEQLLASGYSACYAGAIDYLIEHKKLDAKLSKMECSVELVEKEIGFKFQINLTAYFSNINENDANNLLKQAHKVSPFSHAFGSNINIKTNFKLV